MMKHRFLPFRNGESLLLSASRGERGTFAKKRKDKHGIMRRKRREKKCWRRAKEKIQTKKARRKRESEKREK